MGRKKKGGGHGGRRNSPGAKKTKGDKGAGSPVVKSKGKSSGPKFPIPGLNNLGNTCFFNAVMQNISQSHYFRARLELLNATPSFSVELSLKEKQVTRTMTVDEQLGGLTRSLYSFLGHMISKDRPDGVLNPRGLFSEICQKAPRFRGFQQQDSQELLRYLLDSMRSEEIFRIKRAILGSFNVTKSKDSALSDEDRATIRAFGYQAHFAKTFVDEVFGGMLVSTVVCHECFHNSVIHETFLDLSVPLPEDKSMHTVSPDRKGKQGNRKGFGNIFRSKSAKKPVVDLGLPNPPEAQLSKHQLKKARKKQAKEAKKKPVKQTLQQFLRESEAPNKEEECGLGSGGLKVEEEEEEGAVAVTESQTDNNSVAVESSQTLNALPDEVSMVQCEVASSLTDQVADEVPPSPDSELNAKASLPACSDPDGVAQSSNMDISCPVSNLSGQFAAVAMSEEVARAKEGMQNDCSEEVHTNEGRNQQATVDTAVAVETTVTTELVPSTSTVESETTSSVCAPGLLSPSPLESLRCPIDSLEACLKKFCSRELLTGDNKFACEVCSKRQSHTTTTTRSAELSPHFHSKQNSDDIDIFGEQVGDMWNCESQGTLLKDQNTSVEEKEEQVVRSNAPSPVSEGGREEGNRSSDVESAKESDGDGLLSDEEKEEEEDGGKKMEEKEEKEEEEMEEEKAEEEKKEEEEEEEEKEQEEEEEEQEEEEEEQEKEEEEANEKKTSMVFCEATKQLLIERLPLVLNLHLKRFVQVGRHVRKNGKHISFPALLDIGPFCTPDCKVFGANEKGQLLYSLYGVVEHSGSMRGGHYTTYVRVRPRDKYDSFYMNQTNPAVRTASDSCQAVEESHQSQPDPKPDSQENTTVDGSSDPVEENASLPQPVGGVDSSLSRTKATATSEGACSGTVCGGEGVSAVRCSDGHDGCDGRTVQYDMSLTDGQWYYVSDSSVRTATESEVMKSQAYILFYERLPIKQRN